MSEEHEEHDKMALKVESEESEDDYIPPGQPDRTSPDLLSLGMFGDLGGY